MPDDWNDHIPDDNETVLIRHPDVEGTARVTRAALRLAYEPLGWEETTAKDEADRAAHTRSARKTEQHAASGADATKSA
jgi:hypothetical protein